jgi:hypothetical protein
MDKVQKVSDSDHIAFYCKKSLNFTASSKKIPFKLHLYFL